jgi:hypothetical protein
MHVEFTLATDDGTVENLSAGDLHDELEALDGKRVKVTCVPYAPSPPEPGYAAPLGSDGEPMEHPGGCSVTAVSKL